MSRIDHTSCADVTRKKPLCIDLYAGLGGWSEGFLAEGYQCIGFDIERHDYGTGGYPGQLVIQDVLTLHGSQFKDAAVIVASPPCQKYSYMAMPWTRAKALAAWYREEESRQVELNALFNACFRIAEEAGVPLIVENVRGAQPWVGRSRWHYGSFHLWGDVPALMPMTSHRKVPGLSSCSDFGNDGYKAEGFNVKAAQQFRAENGRKLPAEINESIRQGKSPARWTNSVERRFGLKLPGTKHGGDCFSDPSWPGKRGGQSRGVKGSEDQLGGDRRTWFDGGLTKFGSKSNSRKAASAQIAKIPFPLARHIAQVFKPVSEFIEQETYV